MADTSQSKPNSVKDSFAEQPIDATNGEAIWEVDGDDPTHILMSNFTYAKEQLIKEILESYGDIFDEFHEEAPKKIEGKHTHVKGLDSYYREIKQTEKKRTNKIVKGKNEVKSDENRLKQDIHAIQDYLDADPNYTIKYDNQAYYEEEEEYRKKFTEEIEVPKRIAEEPIINKNRSVGDLVCEWYKTGKFGTNSLFGEFGACVGMPDMGRWNLQASLTWLNNNTGTSSQHCCAKFVRMALEAGGLSTAGRPMNAKAYVNYLPTIGFQKIADFCGDGEYEKYMATAWPGDIAVMQKPGDSSWADGSPAGHICMYDGEKWISDFKQNCAYVYRGANGGRIGRLVIFRWAEAKASGGSFSLGGMLLGGLATIGTAMSGWGIMSANGLSLMITCEGWSDASKKNFFGTPGESAVAGCQGKIDRASVITVGPGLTNAVSPAIKPGVRFSAQQIMALWSKVINDSSKLALKMNPFLATMPQGVKDAAVDCMHSGPGFFKNAGWPSVRTPQQAAQACLRMPMTAKGKIVTGLRDRRYAEAAICLGQRASGSASRYTNAYYSPNNKIVSLTKAIKK